jgi:hypothetical protein
MSEMNGKKLRGAQMHENFFYPGLGEIKKELSAVDSGMNNAVDMTIDEPFVVLRLNDKKSKASYTIPVPITNFKYLVLAKD